LVKGEGKKESQGRGGYQEGLRTAYGRGGNMGERTKGWKKKEERTIAKAESVIARQ